MMTKPDIISIEGSEWEIANAEWEANYGQTAHDAEAKMTEARARSLAEFDD